MWTYLRTIRQRFNNYWYGAEPVETDVSRNPGVSLKKLPVDNPVVPSQSEKNLEQPALRKHGEKQALVTKILKDVEESQAVPIHENTASSGDVENKSVFLSSDAKTPVNPGAQGNKVIVKDFVTDSVNQHELLGSRFGVGFSRVSYDEIVSYVTLQEHLLNEQKLSRIMPNIRLIFQPPQQKLAEPDGFLVNTETGSSLSMQLKSTGKIFRGTNIQNFLIKYEGTDVIVLVVSTSYWEEQKHAISLKGIREQLEWDLSQKKQNIEEALSSPQLAEDDRKVLEESALEVSTQLENLHLIAAEAYNLIWSSDVIILGTDHLPVTQVIKEEAMRALSNNINLMSKTYGFVPKHVSPGVKESKTYMKNLDIFRRRSFSDNDPSTSVLLEDMNLYWVQGLGFSVDGSSMVLFLDLNPGGKYSNFVKFEEKNSSSSSDDGGVDG